MKADLLSGQNICTWRMGASHPVHLRNQHHLSVWELRIAMNYVDENGQVMHRFLWRCSVLWNIQSALWSSWSVR